MSPQGGANGGAGKKNGGKQNAQGGAGQKNRKGNNKNGSGNKSGAGKKSGNGNKNGAGKKNGNGAGKKAVLGKQKGRKKTVQEKRAERAAAKGVSTQRFEEGTEVKHEHPGGAGAILGMKLLRYSGVQGTSLLFSNVMQSLQVVVVAHFLGPSELGRFALLNFMAGLSTQLFSTIVKSGTVRRTFGGGDDDDDDDDDPTAVGKDPRRSLGTGITWSLILSSLVIGLIILLREPLASGLLGDSNSQNLIVWAGVLAGASIVHKTANIIIWLERRPVPFLVSDGSRPTFAIGGMAVMMSVIGGVDGAITGAALGTIVAAVLSVFLLRKSFSFSFDIKEVGKIIAQARFRAPIAISFWLLQNGDVFILSKFVDHKHLGLYSLASRLGFVVSFLPQGFRVAMRPLRASPAFLAVREQYGQATARGQMLAYFALLCIFAMLAMVIGGEFLVDVAPPAYKGAAPLIPFTAAAFVMPALFRTVNMSVTIPRQRAMFIGGVTGGAITFGVVTWILAPHVGVYAAPFGMLAGFATPALIMFVLGQRGEHPIDLPYFQLFKAVVMAVVFAVGFLAIPKLPALVHFALALLVLALYLVMLVVIRVIPEAHRRPLIHMAKSVFAGTTATNLSPRQGLRALAPAERESLRVAIQEGHPPDRIRSGEGLVLMRYLRTAGVAAGLSAIAEPSPMEEEVAVYLFEDAPTAVRNASLRRLLDAKIPPNDMHSVDDFANHLRRIPDEAWTAASGRSRRAAAHLRKVKRVKPRKKATTG